MSRTIKKIHPATEYKIQNSNNPENVSKQNKRFAKLLQILGYFSFQEKKIEKENIIIREQLSETPRSLSFKPVQDFSF